MRLPEITARIRAAYHTRTMQLWVGLCGLMVLGTYAVVGYVILPIRSTAAAFPYHYTIYFGVDRLGPWYMTFMPAYLATALFLTNIVAIACLGERDRALQRLMAVLTILFLSFTLMGAVFVALLNLS